MYKIHFYKDSKGREPVKEYLDSWRNKGDKHSQLNFLKSAEYIKKLSKDGTRAGTPYIKHIDGKIWELRPLRNRIMFFGFEGDSFILLSHYIKKTQKTPKEEIHKAKRLMKDYIERSKDK